MMGVAQSGGWGRYAFRLLLALVGSWTIPVSLVYAAKPVAIRSGGPPSRCSWQIVETANFRILSYDTQPVSREMGRECETLRLELCQRWQGLGAADQNWSPKCDIVLHPNDASYLREVGSGAGSTVASSLVDQREGAIRLRRVDVRCMRSNWLVAALPHELTHVVLAERFSGRTLPRWIDEGIAILADPQEKQTRHHAELVSALADRSTFRVAELLTLADYPAADRWGTFYGQSASVVDFLVEQKGSADFVRFVQKALDLGYDQALRDVYGIGGVVELERRWARQAWEPPHRLVELNPRPAHSAEHASTVALTPQPARMSID